MKKTSCLSVIRILVVLSVFILLSSISCDKGDKKTDSKTGVSEASGNLQNQNTDKLPLLVDLGRGTCIPCKKMKPILEELKAEYEGKAIVRVIDLKDEPKEASRYGIRLIPTQIFFDAEGKEVFRHEGFMDKQSIVAKFAEMGVY